MSRPVQLAPLTTDTAVPGGRFGAPKENGGIFSLPNVHYGRKIAESNALALNQCEVQIAGRSLPEMRKWTRAVALQTAQDWMQRSFGHAPEIRDGLLFVTGHQPSLNHPGVWMKNVAVSHLARCAGTTGLNLVVDNDVAGPPVIRVPAGTRSEPRFENIPYDGPCRAQPWEERHLSSPELFNSFAQRVTEALKPWNIAPGVNSCWPAAVSACERTTHIPALLTACRIADEQSWGISNLELPVSELCQTEPFLAFAQDIIQRFESFFEAYNSAVHWYRRMYRIRNHRHPVPDLERQDARYELPFWYWEQGDADRQRVFAARHGNEIELFAGQRRIAVVPAIGTDLQSMIALQQQGRFRTRALTTTLFTRLCLSDLFIHGIGGARYDEITNRLIETFYEMTVPAFLTLTATLRLPLSPYAVTARDLENLKNQLRKLEIQGPVGEDSPEIQQLRQEQADLIATAVAQRNAGHSKSQRQALKMQNRKRHLQLKRGQQQLQALAESQIAAVRTQIRETEEQLRANRVLNSREYPVCLFDREQLQGMINRLRSEICLGKSS